MPEDRVRSVARACFHDAASASLDWRSRGRIGLARGLLNLSRMKRDSGLFAASNAASSSIEGYDDGTRGEVARYLESGQTQAAVNQLEEFVLRTGRDEEAVTDLAVLYHLTQRAPAARELLRTLIEVRPESHLARKQLALIELLSGNAEVAFAIIEPTLKARPDDVEALKIVGDIASALKLFERAHAFYTKALSVNPADEETRRRLHQLPLAKRA
jgi:tetratricopeptide (TPR) repeat protein